MGKQSGIGEEGFSREIQFIPRLLSLKVQAIPMSDEPPVIRKKNPDYSKLNK